MSHDQPIDLAQAFNSITVNDGADVTWCIDTGSRSHLASDSGRLLSVSNNSNITFVLGNGHSHIHSTHRPLYLPNILVTPDIIKNLIFVRRFTSENKVSI